MRVARLRCASHRIPSGCHPERLPRRPRPLFDHRQDLWIDVTNEISADDGALPEFKRAEATRVVRPNAASHG